MIGVWEEVRNTSIMQALSLQEAPRELALQGLRAAGGLPPKETLVLLLSP